MVILCIWSLFVAVSEVEEDDESLLLAEHPIASYRNDSCGPPLAGPEERQVQLDDP